jgi:hypothetical protein
MILIDMSLERLSSFGREITKFAAKRICVIGIWKQNKYFIFVDSNLAVQKVLINVITKSQAISDNNNKMITLTDLSHWVASCETKKRSFWKSGIIDFESKSIAVKYHAIKTKEIFFRTFLIFSIRCYNDKMLN